VIRPVAVFLAFGVILAGRLAAGPLLPEVTVYGDRENTSPTADTTVLQGASLATGGARTLSEAIAEGVPGVRVEKRGGREGGTSLSIRGISGGRIQIRVDGVIRDASVLDTLAPGDVVRIEIVRGAGAARYGDNAMAGVILVTTRQSRGERPVVRAGLASFSTTAFFARLPLAWTNADVWAAFSRNESQGGWLFPGQVHESPDGATRLAGEAVTALNTGYLDWKVRAGSEIRMDEQTCFRFSAEYLERDAGVPGTIDFPSIRAAMSDSTLAGRVHFETASLLTRGDLLQLNLSGELRTRGYRDFALYDREDRYELAAFAWTSMFEIPCTDEISARLTIEDRIVVLDALVAGGTDTTGRHLRHTLGVSADGEYSGQALTISAAMRLEATGGYAPRFSPSLGASLLLADGVRIFCNAGTAWKIPSLDDLFWPATAFAAGNDRLRPESSWTLDSGVRLVPLEGLQFRVTGFLQHVVDMIHWQPSAGGVWRPANIGEVLAHGLETVVEWAYPVNPVWNLHMQAEYSLQVNRVRAFDSTDGSQIPRTPHEKASASVSLRHRTMGMFRFAAGYTGFRYLNMANTKYLGDHLLVDTSLEIRIGEHWKIRATVENIFDTVAVHLREYPLPGREWSFSLEVQL